MKTQEIPRYIYIYIYVLPAVKERPFKRARDGTYVLLNCPIKAEIRAVDGRSDLRILS